MPIPSNHIIVQVIIITLTFLLAAAFLIWYVALNNKRKRKHNEEKKKLQAEFETELIKTQMEVQEQTLQTIASDIHDNVGQLLSLTRLTLSTVNITEHPQKAEQKVTASLDLLSTAITELRQLASLLHAENILAGGLEHALTKELEWISQSDRYQVACTVSGRREKEIDPQKELIAFRLIQELFSNIIKHADATVIRINYNYQPDEVHIQISDNGKGFDVADRIKNPRGLGVANFFRRARLIGARFTIESEKGKGTTAILTIPYTLN